MILKFTWKRKERGRRIECPGKEIYFYEPSREAAWTGTQLVGLVLRKQRPLGSKWKGFLKRDLLAAELGQSWLFSYLSRGERDDLLKIEQRMEYLQVNTFLAVTFSCQAHAWGSEDPDIRGSPPPPTRWPPTPRRDQSPAPGGPGRRPHSVPRRLRGELGPWGGRHTPGAAEVGSAL